MLDFISSLSHLAQRSEVVVSHPGLPAALHVASGELGNIWLGGCDPLTLLIEKDGVRYDGKEITKQLLSKHLVEYVQLVRQTGSPAVIVVCSAPEVPFLTGLDSLRLLLTSGIDHVVVPTPAISGKVNAGAKRPLSAKRSNKRWTPTPDPPRMREDSAGGR